MSLLANIAAGAIGGTGESLVSIGKTQAQAEIEEAKALRAQAFAEKMYKKQREDTVSDMDTKRNWALDDQSTVLAMEMGDKAVADERYRTETNFKREDAEKQQLILQGKVNSENRKAYTDTLGVINDLDGRIATIQKEMVGVPEDQAASMIIELNGLKARRDEHIEQAKAWLPANLRESFNRHEDTKKYGSASVMSKLPIETVKKISERDYSEVKVKELADAVAKGDTEAKQILTVLTLHNPVVAAQVNALLPAKENDFDPTKKKTKKTTEDSSYRGSTLGGLISWEEGTVGERIKYLEKEAEAADRVNNKSMAKKLREELRKLQSGLLAE